MNSNKNNNNINLIDDNSLLCGASIPFQYRTFRDAPIKESGLPYEIYEADPNRSLKEEKILKYNLQKNNPYNIYDSRSFDIKMEEIMLLWKTNRKIEAGRKANFLIIRYPEKEELLTFQIERYIEEHNFFKARKLLDLLESNTENEIILFYPKLSLAIADDHFKEAEKVILGSIEPKDSIFGSEFAKDYAFILSKLKEWPKSAELYYQVARQNINNSEESCFRTLWDARSAILRGSNMIWSEISFESDADAEKHYNLTVGYQDWLREKIRGQLYLNYSDDSQKGQPELGISSFNDNITSIKILFDYFVNDNITWTPHVKFDLYDSKFEPEIGLRATLEKSRYRNLYSEVGYTYNIKELSLSDQRLDLHRNNLNTFGIFNINNYLYVSYIFNDNWFHINPKMTPLTEQSYFGNKISHEEEIGLQILRKPCFNLFFLSHFYYGYWNKSFESAPIYWI